MNNKRTIMISYRNMTANSGGSSGVNYNILKYNQTKGIISNLLNIFKDCYCVDGKTYGIDGTILQNVISAKNRNKENSRIKELVLRMPFISLIIYWARLGKATSWMNKIQKQVLLSSNDSIIIHDIEAAYAFCKVTNNIKFALVYHQQGSLYSEWESIHNQKSYILSRYMSRIQRKIFEQAEIVGFPSFGSVNELKKTIGTSEYLHCLQQKIKILYNGFDAVYNFGETQYADDVLGKIMDNERIFITVSTITKHKGVDRIPDFLGFLKKNNVSFSWIIIGDGSASDEVFAGIKKNSIESNVIWEKKPLPHGDVLKLLSKSHFYILLHRVSIFDFSIIEAMSYGVVPILTSTGGNLEMVIDGVNGLFIDEEEDYKKYLKCVNKSKYTDMQNKCLEFQKKYSVNSFLKSYLDLTDSLG